jgi:hypothetical protein
LYPRAIAESANKSIGFMRFRPALRQSSARHAPAHLSLSPGRSPLRRVAAAPPARLARPSFGGFGFGAEVSGQRLLDQPPDRL